MKKNIFIVFLLLFALLTFLGYATGYENVGTGGLSLLMLTLFIGFIYHQINTTKNKTRKTAHNESKPKDTCPSKPVQNPYPPKQTKYREDFCQTAVQFFADFDAKFIDKYTKNIAKTNSAKFDYLIFLLRMQILCLSAYILNSEFYMLTMVYENRILKEYAARYQIEYEDVFIQRALVCYEKICKMEKNEKFNDILYDAVYQFIVADIHGKPRLKPDAPIFIAPTNEMMEITHEITQNYKLCMDLLEKDIDRIIDDGRHCFCHAAEHPSKDTFQQNEELEITRLSLVHYYLDLGEKFAKDMDREERFEECKEEISARMSTLIRTQEKLHGSDFLTFDFHNMTSDTEIANKLNKKLIDEDKINDVWSYISIHAYAILFYYLFDLPEADMLIRLTPFDTVIESLVAVLENDQQYETDEEFVNALTRKLLIARQRKREE